MMLNICDRRSSLGRRGFLQVGSLALGSLSLPQLLSLQAAAAGRQDLLRDKSVVFLFMHGGPSQVETFDPKMTAPAGIRSATGEVATTVPGMTFGGTFTKLAQQARRLSVVRSYTTGDANHDIKPIVGRPTLGANLGSLYARVAGTTGPTGMPTNALLCPQSVEPKSSPLVTQFGRFNSTGSLGSAYAPFVPQDDSPLQESLKLSLARTRLDDRRELISQLDRLRRQVDASGLMEGLDRFQQQSFETITSGIADAFDLAKEDPATVARYDTAGLVRPEEISRKWNNYNCYVAHGKTLGKLMLLARRLCESGCRFVTVTTDFVWDNHADSNNAGVEEGMEYCGLPFDHAVSTFLEDVHQRGLSEKILLVCSGEIGRTPRIDQNGGRNHWGNLAPLMLAGGGLQMGKVVGQSTRDASQPLSNPYGLDNLVATILHSMLDVGQLRLDASLPTDLARLITTGQPIEELM